jgi:hypothetical protein
MELLVIFTVMEYLLQKLRIGTWAVPDVKDQYGCRSATSPMHLKVPLHHITSELPKQAGLRSVHKHGTGRIELD